VPADCDFDPTKISLAVVGNPDYELPEGWKTIELMGNQLQWTVKAYSLGSFNVRVMYDGEDKGDGIVNVNQRLHLKDGWQWIALQGTISDNALKQVFGDKIVEARSDVDMMINDSQVGYWGTLRIMSDDRTYKVKRNLGAD
jgi:hypothetical protein